MISGRVSARQTAMVMLAIYWVGFWLSFFRHAVPTPVERGYEAIGPIFRIFHLGVGANLAAVAQMPWFISSFWLNPACWLLTWPLTKLDLDLLGTNADGARLIVVTALSFLQWSMVISLIERFRQRHQNARFSGHTH